MIPVIGTILVYLLIGAFSIGAIVCAIVGFMFLVNYKR